MPNRKPDTSPENVARILREAAKKIVSDSGTMRKSHTRWMEYNLLAAELGSIAWALYPLSGQVGYVAVAPDAQNAPRIHSEN